MLSIISSQPIWTILSLSFIFVLFGCTNSADSNENQEKPEEEQQALTLKEELDAWVEDFELMGAAVLLIVDGEAVVEEYFGMARPGYQVDERTTYRVASISKTLSTLAVMKLVEDGKMDLNEDASTYLGWRLRNPAHPDQVIRVRDLLGHRSSIRDGAAYGEFVAAMQDGAVDIRELFQPEGRFFTEDMFADHEVGAYFSYSNSAWGLIASMVERVSEQRFDRFTKEVLFEPMGMQASFNIMDIPLERVATLYRATNGRWMPQADDVSSQPPQERAPENYALGSNGLIYGPQGSLRASAKDLLQVAKLLMNDGMVDGSQILSKESMQLLRSNRWNYNGSNGDTWDNFWRSYSYGLHFITNADSADIIFPDREMQGHPGIAYGLLSDMYVDPETKSGVIFITNGSKQEYQYGASSSFYGVEERLFKILYPYLLQKESE